MKHIRLLVAVSVLLSVICAGASLFISSDATADNPAAFHSLFAISIAVTILHTGAALGFLYGLKNFKAGLKLAYRLLCTGFIFLGLTFFQTPLLSLYDLWDSPWVEYGGIILPLLIAAVCLYLGARKFARLLGVKSPAIYFWVATMAAVAMVGLVLVVPHPYTGVEEQQARASAAFSGVLTAYLVCATWAMQRAYQKVGLHLKQATKWLVIVLAVAALAGLQHTALGLFLSHEHWYQTYGISIIVHVIDGLLVLRAAYMFNKASEDDTTAVPASNENTAGDSPIDIVLYAASLASSPADIDATLDGLRFVTANLKGRTELTPEEQQRLARVYSAIEEYLVSGERLRNYSQDEVKQKVRSHFEQSATNEVFWKSAQL